MTIPQSILNKSREVFAANPKAAFLYATADGNFFLPQAKTHAEYHSEVTGTTLYTITPADLPQPKPTKRTKTKK